MSSDINKIKDFLGRRNGYLKCGNQRISDALDVEYGGFGTSTLEEMIDSDGTYHTTQIICQDGGFFFGGKKY